MIEGKTKIITDNGNDTITISTKNILTAGDGIKKEEICVGHHKTTQTVNVFNLLSNKNIPNAYISRESNDSIKCHKCDMLPLEFVARRYAYGSYLKRTNVKSGYYFFTPLQEIFHKHSVIIEENKKYMIPENEAREKFLINGEWKNVNVYTDPLIVLGKTGWHLYPNNKENVIKLLTIKPELSMGDLSECGKFLLSCFEVIEEAWGKIETKHGPVSLVDMKIEIGRKSNGQLVIADVIDNDSWRIWPGGDPKNQLDKQCFRDGDVSGIEEKYELVAKLTEQFVV